MDGLIVGVKIPSDHPYDARKYIRPASTYYHMGTSSGSPAHLVENQRAKTVYITEGSLKCDLSYALSGKVGKCIFIEDICAKTKGYELLYRLQKKVR